MCLFLLNTRQSAKAIRCALTHTLKKKPTTIRINWKLIANGIADVEQNAYERDSRHCHRQHLCPTTITTATKMPKIQKLSAICFLITLNWFTQFRRRSSICTAGCIVCVCVFEFMSCSNFDDDVNAYISSMKSVHSNFYQPIIDTHLLHPGCLFFCRFNRTLIIIL